MVAGGCEGKVDVGRGVAGLLGVVGTGVGFQVFEGAGALLGNGMEGGADVKGGGVRGGG